MSTTLQTNKADVILNTYALAKASWLEDDFVSSFVPMAASLINKKGYGTIKSDFFESDFEDEYGIKIPSQPAIKLLSILQRKELITYCEEIHIWKPNIESIRKIDISEKKTALQRGIEKISVELVTFAKTQFNKIISTDEAKSVLYSFVQANSAKILNEEPSNYTTSFDTRNLTGSFIIYIKLNNADLFNFIKQITIGRLLVDALTISESEETNEDFIDSKIYIDTRLFLNLIGFYGNYREKSSIDLIDKLLAKGAILVLFKHIYDEINYILSGCANWIESISYDPEKASSALRYLKSSGKDKKYVESLITSIPSKLKQFKIEIDYASLVGDDYSFQIDRDELTSIIKSCYESNNIIITDRVEDTIDYDVDSVQSIYHQRKNIEAYNIYEKNIFLLTTNRNLVYACKKYHNSHYTKNTTPSVVSDIFLGTFIWTRSGIECCENITTDKLIADCYTAMEPTQYAINKFCTHISELKEHGNISEAEVIALKCYGLQTQAIRPFLANPNDYEYRDLQDVLEEIRQKTIASEKSKFDKEKIYLESQISDLNEKYGITEQEFIKYRDMALCLEKNQKDKETEAIAELAEFANKAEDRLNVIPIIINAIFNTFVQIALLWVTNSWVSVPLRITIPVFSVMLGLALHFNWFNIKDAIKYRLILSYKKKADNKKRKNAIKNFLITSSVSKTEDQ